MTTKYTYYKNSNSGELFFTQEFKGERISGIYFYDKNGIPVEQKSLEGFVTVSEKKFKREVRKCIKT